MDTHVICEVKGRAGLITLNRAKALNALSLAMIRAITASLLAWRDDAAVSVVGMRGVSKPASACAAGQPFGTFCAGGDIRFFHQAALAGNPELEDFFTEEYRLNHLIHTYPKPVVAFMDGIVMGGGMGLGQGASVRIATGRTKMAMPETNIGLFPDVGGGYFLSRCPGHVGEYLALTGQVIDAAQALTVGLADARVEAGQLATLWAGLATDGAPQVSSFAASDDHSPWSRDQIDHYFSLPTLLEIIQALEAAAPTVDWARDAAAALRQRSPLMLHVTLEQIRRARSMGLADDLRMERDLMRHCFHPAHLQRSGALTEVVEGIRALAVDKDHTARWNPLRIEDVTPAMVAPFFHSPWPAHAHPLRDLA